jgi:hypothetical protein
MAKDAILMVRLNIYPRATINTRNFNMMRPKRLDLLVLHATMIRIFVSVLRKLLNLTQVVKFSKKMCLLRTDPCLSDSQANASMNVLSALVSLSEKVRPGAPWNNSLCIMRTLLVKR